MLKEGEILPQEEEGPTQRLYNSGKASSLQRVSLPSRGDRDSPSTKVEPSLSTQLATSQSQVDLEAQLAQSCKNKALYQVATTKKYLVYIFSQIEKTSQAIYLKGYLLYKVAQLLDYLLASKPSLIVLYSTFNALIKDVYKLVLEGNQINTFTLYRVNSFILNYYFKRLLLTKLINSTY